MLTNVHATNTPTRFASQVALKPHFQFDPISYDETVEAGRCEATVQIFPAHQVKRRTASWNGMAVEIVQATNSKSLEFRFKAPMHLFVYVEQGVRRYGETSAGNLRSSLRDTARKLIFVPAGYDYRDRYEPRNAPRLAFFYIDPELMLSRDDVALTPRLFFEDAMLLSTVQKIIQLVEGPESENHLYLGALGLVLQHELARFYQRNRHSKQTLRGGLAAWQQRKVTAFIEDHLDEAIPLQVLADLAGLSPYHFCRAFKQSFGVPPHRYHTRRRIDRAKELLVQASSSVTQIGLEVGFSETSAFSAAFRKIAGLTPTAYRRSLA